MGARLLEASGRRLSAPLDFENVVMDLRAGDEIALLADGGKSIRIRSEALPSVRAERVRILTDLEIPLRHLKAAAACKRLDVTKRTPNTADLTRPPRYCRAPSAVRRTAVKAELLV